MIKFGKFQIHPSFIFFAVVIIALGYIKQLFFLFIATTIHEMSHVMVAKLMGLKAERVILTPMGEIAVINGFDEAFSYKKYLIILAGPLSNIVPAVLLLINGKADEFMYINFTIGLFNMLPFYPLDGGRLLYTYLGNKIGILKGREVVKLITKIGIWIFCLLGFAQTILHPFNMSLIAIAAFFITIYKNEKEAMLFSYYRCMLNKYKKMAIGIKTKTAVLHKGADINCICSNFTWDYYHIIHIIDNGEIVQTLTEGQIFRENLTGGMVSFIK